MLTALVWAWDTDTKADAKAVRNLVFSIEGTTVSEVLNDMQRCMADSGANVVDIIKKFDVDASRAMRVDPLEFDRAMRTHFSFNGPLTLVDKIFDRLDTDGSGNPSPQLEVRSPASRTIYKVDA